MTNHNTGRPGRRRYFRVRDLEKFQHYKDRAPKWVKLYSAIIEGYDFQQLPDETKYHALALLILASKTDNKIPEDSEWIARQIGAVSPVELEQLFEIGFIERYTEKHEIPRNSKKLQGQVASKTGAEPYQLASNSGAKVEHSASETGAEPYQLASLEGEGEKEREEETEKNSLSQPSPSKQRGRERETSSPVRSRHSLETRIEYAEWRKAKGEPIRSPIAVAKTALADGSEDGLIDQYLEVKQQAEARRRKQAAQEEAELRAYAQELLDRANGDFSNLAGSERDLLQSFGMLPEEATQ